MQATKWSQIITIITPLYNAFPSTKCLTISSLIAALCIRTTCYKTNGVRLILFYKFHCLGIPLQESCKPSPPQKPLPADPQNKANRLNSVSSTMLGFPKPAPHIAPVRFVWSSICMLQTEKCFFGTV